MSSVQDPAGIYDNNPTLQFAQPKFEMSPQIGELSSALSKARKSFKPIIKDTENPFYKKKYADLSAVIDATKDGLSDNELAVLQPPAYGGDGSVQIITLLSHSSGQWIKATLDMPVSKTDAQGIGSAITYGRRYAYSAVLNVASEDDDDANSAVASDKPKFQAPQRKSQVEVKEMAAPAPEELNAVFTDAPVDASPFEKDTARKTCRHDHIVPAGVSKKSGKPYPAFCRDCGAHERQ